MLRKRLKVTKPKTRKVANSNKSLNVESTVQNIPSEYAHMSIQYGNRFF